MDCVKLAKHVILKDRTIDLCVSGINHGSNASINIIYSGTMSAAMEASMEGIRSIGFSLLDFSFDADFRPCRPWVRKIMEYALQNRFGDTQLLNVNIPRAGAEDIRGIRVCHQAKGYWREKFVEGRDPSGQPYYWLSGEYINTDPSEESDIYALKQNYISVVPSMHDLTDYRSIGQIRHLEQIAAGS